MRPLAFSILAHVGMLIYASEHVVSTRTISANVRRPKVAPKKISAPTLSREIPVIFAPRQAKKTSRKGKKGISKRSPFLETQLIETESIDKKRWGLTKTTQKILTREKGALGETLPFSVEEAKSGRIDHVLAHSRHDNESIKAAYWEKMRVNPDGTYTYKDSTIVATIGRDGRTSIEDAPAIGGKIQWLPKKEKSTEEAEKKFNLPRIIPVLRVNFDLTAMMMRAGGQDPYLANKLQFLRTTEDERHNLRAEYRMRNLSEQVNELPRHLRSLWSDTRIPVEKRKTLLFEIWDGCDDVSQDKAKRQAASRARAHVLSFIRNELPRTSDFHYTADEIQQVNSRRLSKEKFAPYAASAPSR